ncbi:MAG: hypothetical protein ACREBS_07975 [Nitrososphaerales archaeon]
MQVTVHGGKVVDLTIVPLIQIKPHEDTVPFLLDSIKRDMKRTGYQRDPILTDRKTHLAFDGTHRFKALSAIGAKYALCAQFNYLGPSVKLERWLRYAIAPSQDLISTIASVFHMRRSSSIRRAISQVDNGSSGVALLSTNKSLVSQDAPDALHVYRKLRRIDKLCENENVDLQFAAESQKYDLFSSKSIFVLYPMKLSKKDVLRTVKNHGVFPYKTTRHIVPVRPMGMYFPLECLQRSTLTECSEKLEQIVKFSKVKLKQRNVWYEGRRYSERLAVFTGIS